ncbi:hypothetical protein ACQE3E_15680 [Methylomonas sp. MED-D]|uniref:hypothetical protein n=1 Tax=unclassified Methylomonas TaxID=2608980 RepID=UPI003D083E8F
MKLLPANEQSSELIRAGESLTVVGTVIIELVIGGVRQPAVSLVSESYGPVARDTTVIISALATAAQYLVGDAEVAAIVRTGLDVRTQTNVILAAVIGDSNATVGTSTSPDNQDISVHTAAFPASGATSIGITPHKFILDMLMPNVRLVGHYGVSGAMTSGGTSPIGLLDRDIQSASITRRAISDLLAQKLHVIFLRCMSINNLQNLISSSYWLDVAQDTFEDHVKIVSLLSSAGIPILDQMYPGYGGPLGEEYASSSTPWRNEIRAAMLWLSREIQGYFANSDQVFVLNPDGITRDANTGRYLFNRSGDHLHLNMIGQYENAKRAEMPRLEKLFGKSMGVRYPGANKFTNPVFANLATTPNYGTELATGITIGTTGSGVTRAGAKREYREGRPYQVCEAVLSSTATGGLTFDFDIPLLTTAFNANDVFGFEWPFFWEPLDAQDYLISSFSGKVDLTKSGAGRFVPNRDPGANNYGLLTGNGIAGVLTFNPVQITEANTALSVSLVRHTVTTTGTVGRWKFGVGTPRMVSLSSVGGIYV